jgi:hypothetical protein
MAYGAGVLTQSDFAIFQDHGYWGLMPERRRRTFTCASD